MNDHESLDLETFSNLVDPVATRRTGSLEPMDAQTRQRLYHLIDTVQVFFNLLATKIWATSGTLLGAIRHADLVPHDDDADFGVKKSGVTDLLASAATRELLVKLFLSTHGNDDAGDDARLKKNESQLIRALRFLKSRGVAFCVAASLGFKFFVVSQSDISEPTWPYLDVFVMKQFTSLKLLRQQHPALARKLDGGGEEEEPVLVVHSNVGRTLFKDETYFAAAVGTLEMVPFGPLTVAIPERKHALDFLDRNYGSDWSSVIRSHHLDHATGEKLHVVEKQFVTLDSENQSK